jgi:hypothetical protein
VRNSEEEGGRERKGQKRENVREWSRGTLRNCKGKKENKEKVKEMNRR